MALLDLSLITRSIIKLLEESFRISPAWAPAPPPNIKPQSPDRLSGDEMGFYLYHIAEDPHYKNLPTNGEAESPVKHTPMALNLHYQLSASSSSDNDGGAYLEQQMMGIAIKALHDYPIINDSTEVNSVKILSTTLQGNSNILKIVLQPTAPNEAISYWTAGTSPLRLSAYYQVSVILLEPEKPESPSGRVLTYGVHTFVEGLPRILSSYNILPLNIPGRPAGSIELRPSQVPIGQRITFTGSGFDGDNILLLLNNSRWNEPVEADVSWGVVATREKVTAVVQQAISGEDILPGVYSAIVKVTRRITLSDGSTRDFEHKSNESPFLITPRVDSVSEAGGKWTVTGYPFRDPHPPAQPPPRIRDMQVYIGSIQLQAMTGGALSAGEFRIIDTQTIELILPAGLASNTYYPLRIFVNGAETNPEWIET